MIVTPIHAQVRASNTIMTGPAYRLLVDKLCPSQSPSQSLALLLNKLTLSSWLSLAGVWRNGEKIMTWSKPLKTLRRHVPLSSSVVLVHVVVDGTWRENYDLYGWNPYKSLRHHVPLSSSSPIVYVLVDGGWTDWSEYSACSVTCDSGEQTKHRSCTNPAPKYGGRPCPGQAKSVRSCVMPRCHVPSEQLFVVCFIFILPGNLQQTLIGLLTGGPESGD